MDKLIMEVLKPLDLVRLSGAFWALGKAQDTRGG